MTTDRATIRPLTRGQKAILIGATLPMIAVGIGGAIGTYTNAKSQLQESGTAIGVVAAGEGATLVASLVMIGVTMLGQAAPRVVRAALWLIPAAASIMGLAIAPHLREAVVYAITPMAMTASAEGISFLARRIVTHTSGEDVEAQRRNAEVMRKIAFHAAQAERHPDPKVQKKSALEAWRLMRSIGDGDAQLGSRLIDTSRERLTQGADTALVAMLTGATEPIAAHPTAPALETAQIRETGTEPAGETNGSTVLTSQLTDTTDPKALPTVTDQAPIIDRADQPLRREPVLSPAEPLLTRTIQTAPEPTAETDPGEPTEPGEPENGSDEKENQITTLAHRIKQGERLTKSSAAQILGVSPATAGRRLAVARARVSDGTGMYL